MKKVILLLLCCVGYSMAGVSVYDDFDIPSVSYYDTSMSDTGLNTDSTYVYSGSNSVKLNYDGSPGFTRVAITENFGILNDFQSVSFMANVVSNYAHSDKAPYTLIKLDANNNGVYNSGIDPYIIAFFSESFTNDTWFETGLDMNTNVHIPSSPYPYGRGDLPDGTYSASGTTDTLYSLSLQEYSSGLTFGEMEIIEIRIGAGEWSPTEDYLAYVDHVTVTTANVVPAPGALLLSAVGLPFVRKLRRKIG